MFKRKFCWNCALPGHYAASSGNFLPTFRDNLWAPIFRSQESKGICSTKVTIWLRFATNVQQSHRQPQCTWQLVRKDRVLFVWFDLHVSLCGQMHLK